MTVTVRPEPIVADDITVTALVAIRLSIFLLYDEKCCFE